MTGELALAEATEIHPGNHTRREWAKRINTAWRKTLDSIFETGDELIAAKADLKHGQWEKLIDSDLPFGKRTADRLMAIARDPRLRKGTYTSLLPPSWMTLYLIHQLPDDRLAESFKAKTIHPKLGQREVKFLPDPPPEKPKRKSKENGESTGSDDPFDTTVTDKLMDCLRALQSALKEIGSIIDPAERPEFFQRLHDMINKFERSLDQEGGE